MNKKGKITRLFKPSMRLYFLVLVFFLIAAFVTAFFELRIWFLVGAEGVLLILLAVYSSISGKRKQLEVVSYIESSMTDLDGATKNTLLNMPLPMVIYDISDGKVLWSNDGFMSITGGSEHFFEVDFKDMVPNFSAKWLMDGHNVSPDAVQVGDRKYKVFGNINRVGEMSGARSFLGLLYWVDITDLENIRTEYNQSRPIMAVIVLDNYEELFRNLTDTVKSSLQAAIDNKIGEWVKGSGGYLSKYDRDRYIFIFEEKHLKQFVDGHFSILDSVREILNPSGVAATVSIGIGRGAASFEESFHFATLGIEMALSRGGDQAVIRNKLNFEFYGGRSVAVERRTKVKSRVMANAMGELISDASNVIIMGHKYADIDCVGAAIGLANIARRRGKKVKFICDIEYNAAEQLIKRMKKLSEYEDFFISAEDAMIMADSKTLLIVVDTNRPEQTESPELLKSCTRVAVIDHHRRSATYISNAALNFHEPFASSASELVAELLPYLGEMSELMKTEAEALLAGIVLDTKNFTMRTGSRTFEAAAYLRRAGSDTTEVKRLFQNDLAETKAKYRIIQSARIIRDGIALAAMDSQEDRIVSAQAADELLNILGVNASFVIYYDKDVINISARSIGDINVQYILEKLGGGGNKSMAGAQIKGQTVSDVRNRLIEAINTYVDEITQ